MPGKTKIKYIQSLGEKKFRDDENVFVAEGPKLIRDLIEANATIHEIFAVKEWLSENKNTLGNITVQEITPDDLKKISSLTTPNKVLAIVKKFETRPTREKDTLILALDGIQDPGNLGTIIRIADWFGLGQIVCSPGCADVYNPKVVQATMGSIARVNIFYAELGTWIASRKDLRVYASALEGKDVRKMKIKEGILIIGNEAKGISRGLLDLANEKITIPRLGKAESLNVAVATGIILSHVI